MAQTKYDLANSRAVSDQEALVKLINGPPKKRKIKHIIPGGKHLFQTNMDTQELYKRIYTWLKRVRTFDECTLSFSRNPEAYSYSLQKIQEFPSTMQVPIWMIPSKGKDFLARTLAEQITRATKPPVLLVVKKDGIYIATSDKFKMSNEDWEPYLEFIAPKVN